MWASGAVDRNSNGMGKNKCINTRRAGLTEKESTGNVLEAAAVVYYRGQQQDFLGVLCRLLLCSTSSHTWRTRIHRSLLLCWRLDFAAYIGRTWEGVYLLLSTRSQEHNRTMIYVDSSAVVYSCTFVVLLSQRHGEGRAGRLPRKTLLPYTHSCLPEEQKSLALYVCTCEGESSI